MILHAYTMYDKKIKVYGAIQFTKENSEDLKTAYERQAVKNLEEVKKFKDNILYYVGTYDDNIGVLVQLEEKNTVIDFDSLILDNMEVPNVIQ